MLGEGEEETKKTCWNNEELGENFMKSSLNMGNIQNPFRVCQFTCGRGNISDTHAIALWSSAISVWTVWTGAWEPIFSIREYCCRKIRNCWFSNGIPVRRVRTAVGQKDEGSTGEFTTGNTFMIEQGQSSYSVDERLSPTDEKNDEDSDWLCEYLTKI